MREVAETSRSQPRCRPVERLAPRHELSSSAARTTSLDRRPGMLGESIPAWRRRLLAEASSSRTCPRCRRRLPTRRPVGRPPGRAAQPTSSTTNRKCGRCRNPEYLNSACPCPHVVYSPPWRRRRRHGEARSVGGTSARRDAALRTCARPLVDGRCSRAAMAPVIALRMRCAALAACPSAAEQSCAARAGVGQARRRDGPQRTSLIAVMVVDTIAPSLPSPSSACCSTSMCSCGQPGGRRMLLHRWPCCPRGGQRLAWPEERRAASRRSSA